MLGTLESDVATSIAILDRLPAADGRNGCRCSTAAPIAMCWAGLPGIPELTGRGAVIAATIREAVGRRFPVTSKPFPATASVFRRI